jgi:glucose-1-phosphate cytidylyltransferase
MQVVILAGGFGSRISEESHLIPKPMIRILDKPILWHIMKYYSFYGHNDFIICGGYKQDVIKEYFNNYMINFSDVTYDFTLGKTIFHNNLNEKWNVTVIDTGLNTMTGGRLKRIANYIKDEVFLMTYGDGLSDVNINSLIHFHEKHSKLATITTIQPEGRFGLVDIDKNDLITQFNEKKQNDNGWINGGFMVLNKKSLEFIDSDLTIFEKEPLEKLADLKQLNAYKHFGYWQCMDTLRDKNKLESDLKLGVAKWKKW